MQQIDLIGVGAGLVVAVAAIIWTVTRLRSGRRTSGAVGGLAVVAALVASATGAQIVFGHAAPAASAAQTQGVATMPVPPTATWAAERIDSGPGYSRIQRLRIPSFPESLRTSSLRRYSSTPAHGLVGSVVIPATRSHFTARPAIVYLPPAALVPQPRLVPVVVAFSGQSRGAGPRDLVWSGDLRQMMDAIAAKHHGVAPIVVVPDQLGPATDNPMCVDSKRFGHVATYVMTDVRNWIRDRLPVRPGRSSWTVAGFSEGGTCAIQFGAAHPDVFGSLVDVSGEEAPKNGSLQHTIDVGFDGDRAAYERATPAWLLAHHRYHDEQALFAAGELDRAYGPVALWMERRARAAGMTTARLAIPGLGHNWTTATAGLRWGFGRLVGVWDL